MAHPNSVEAYVGIKPSLNDKYSEIAAIFQQNGPLARFQLYEIMEQVNPEQANFAKGYSARNSLTARLAEMKNMDILEACGDLVNPLTKKPNEVLRLTGRPPKEYEPESPWRVRYIDLEAKYKMLEDYVRDLEAMYEAR